ncbi:MAG: Gfo/Idh/MocA family oxidoreductase [Acidobacteriaceae bacterium]|nr:Gfo/Idh/MocA family oxidoreductase [Acidobacteriaceae bacterium]MBV9501740.1 Gfo/Idh/MocA family oxidoreductase [Acidobacteriaceae bacterium]
MKKIKTAIAGTGFMGKVHTENVRRLPNVEVAAVVGSRPETARKFAEAMSIPIATDNLNEVLANKEIEAIHICTPNVNHYPMSLAAIEAGKAVLCEKPMTMDVEEARKLVDAAKAKNAVNCVQHNLRYYPSVQQMRQMVAHGDLGEILIVQGTYSQDWLLYDTDWNWRLDRKENGPLRVMGDIGSHWMDMIQHLTGLSISAVCADLAIFHKERKRPKGSVETFSGKKAVAQDYQSFPIDTEDFGAVLLHLGTRARGAFTVSQMSAGRKNRFAFEIFGTKAGVSWDQESPDTLWIGHRNEPNQIIVKDASLFYPEAGAFADLPGGHSEGYDDSHKQVFKRFYARVADPSAPVDYPTFEDGLRGMILLRSVAESAQKRAWVDVPA